MLEFAYSLPKLSYDYGALEPYIDAMTMEIHHTKHHQAYIDNLNKAMEQVPALQGTPLTELLSSLDSVPESVRAVVRNHGGGHYNHSVFWKMLSRDGGGEPQGPVGDIIKKEFGSFAAFQDQFNTAAKGVFGSGWAWLCVAPNGQYKIIATPNQDTPLSQGSQPILGLDVWEHAYYLKYQNKRPDYINAWWHVVNWEQVEENYSTIVR
ncbi:MAG: superoxide dismutase [Candidatus Dependentiae bacterium]|nr:superoxide dismutase [Candidatus Dependentiae bacterium]